MPPLYKETIVLCLDDDGMWLWLQNYEDVFFADGSPNAIISLKIGLGIFEERLTFPNLMKRWSLSQWLDVPEVINFQQQILANRNRPSQPKSNLYSLGLILAALKAIGLAPQGDAEPTDGTQPDDLIKKYLAEYTNKKYPRSWWEAIPIKDQKYPEFKYRAKVESLLSPKQYKKYEQELGFVGYFPKPCWVRQEQQAELRDAKSPRGTTRNHDPRDIKPAKSHILKNIPSQWEWQKIPDEIFAHVDKLLQKEKGKEKAKTSSSSTAPNISGGATPGTKHGQLRRIDCYGFRGDTRDPIAVQAAQGFFCNATRSDVEDKEVKEKVALVDAALEKAKKKHNIETLFAALIETGVLNLGAVHWES